MPGHLQVAQHLRSQSIWRHILVSQAYCQNVPFRLPFPGHLPDQGTQMSRQLCRYLFMVTFILFRQGIRLQSQVSPHWFPHSFSTMLIQNFYFRHTDI